MIAVVFVILISTESNFEIDTLNTIIFVMFFKSLLLLEKSKILSYISFANVLAVYVPILLMDFGVGIIFNAYSFKGSVVGKVSKIAQSIWLLHQIHMLIMFLVLFCVATSYLEALCVVCRLPITIFMIVMVLRKLCISRIYDASDENPNKLMHLIFVDSNITGLLLFGVFLSILLNGVPFYTDNTHNIVYLFDIDHLLNARSFVTIICVFLLSLNLGLVFLCFFEKALKIKALVVQILMLTAMLLLFPSMGYMPASWICAIENSVIYVNCLSYLAIAMQMLAIVLVWQNFFKAAFMVGVVIVVILVHTIGLMIFPYILPSSLGAEHGLRIYEHLSAERTEIVVFVAASCYCFFYAFFKRLFIGDNCEIDKDNFYFLIIIASLLLILYFLSARNLLA